MWGQHKLHDMGIMWGLPRQYRVHSKGILWGTLPQLGIWCGTCRDLIKSRHGATVRGDVVGCTALVGDMVGNMYSKILHDPYVGMSHCFSWKCGGEHVRIWQNPQIIPMWAHCGDVMGHTALAGDVVGNINIHIAYMQGLVKSPHDRYEYENISTIICSHFWVKLYKIFKTSSDLCYMIYPHTILMLSHIVHPMLSRRYCHVVYPTLCPCYLHVVHPTLSPCNAAHAIPMQCTPHYPHVMQPTLSPCSAPHTIPM